MGYGRKASVDPAAAAADEADGAAVEEPQAASLMMAAARIHRRRQAANLTSPVSKVSYLHAAIAQGNCLPLFFYQSTISCTGEGHWKQHNLQYHPQTASIVPLRLDFCYMQERTAASMGDIGAQDSDSLDTSDPASIPVGSGPALIATSNDSTPAELAGNAWSAPELEADAEQLACANPTEAVQPRQRLMSQNSTAAALPSKNLDQASADAGSPGRKDGKDISQPKVITPFLH